MNAQTQADDASTSAPLVIHDTLTGQKQPLELREPGRCGFYCCGPTVYDLSHIGHARAALVPDLLLRFLRHRGIEVTYVRNITDIDDKIIKRANERGEGATALAQRYTDEYHRDLGALNCLEPSVEPRVSQTIGPIIELIQTLERGGLTYAIEGDVYYRVKNFSGYGKLSKTNLEDLKAGARVDVDTRKESPLDFALWKAAKPGEPSWESPWGQGRPGWHIECSAMSSQHLGKTFDIHLGGRDLIFPHHENEIAQSQGAHGEHTYARYWMHNGFVNFAGEKMSKSLGNFFTIREVTALYHPEVIRYFLLGVHYRSAINFDIEVTCPACEAPLSAKEQKNKRCASCGHESTTELLRARVRFLGLEEADDRVAYVYTTLARAREFLDSGAGENKPQADVPAVILGMLRGVERAMHDDLNTAAALAELSAPLSELNRLLDLPGKKRKKHRETIGRFVEDLTPVAQILGVFGRAPTRYLAARRDLKVARMGLDTAKVETLMAARQEARAAKDWARADAVREELLALGVEVQDGPSGSFWTV